MSWLSKGLKKATKAVSKAGKQFVNLQKATLAPVKINKTKLALTKSATKVVGSKTAKIVNKGLNVGAGVALGAATGGLAGAALAGAGQLKTQGGFGVGTVANVISGTGAGNMSGFGDILGGLGDTIREGTAIYKDVSSVFKKPDHTGSKTLSVPSMSEDYQGPPAQDNSQGTNLLLLGGIALGALLLLKD
jgi:hypothetical protein